MLRTRGSTRAAAATVSVAVALVPAAVPGAHARTGGPESRVEAWSEGNHLARRLHDEGEATAERRRLRERAAIRASRRLLRRGRSRPVQPLGASAKGFIWPVNDDINSPFGARWGQTHTGIDIDGDLGRAVGAAKGGVVVRASDFGGYGLTVSIDHGGGVTTLYAHLSREAVELGDEVGRGEVIGRVGCTGNCTGNHLHFEVQVGGVPRKPAAFLP